MKPAGSVPTAVGGFVREVLSSLRLSGSALFALYVNNFGKYNETYGSIGAVIVLMLWLYLTAFVVLLGAELNGETEEQVGADTSSD